MINKVILVGNLGQDPEIRSTQTGTLVAHLTLATHRRWSDREGQRHEETEWHRIVLWSRNAEIARDYLIRGKLIYLEGRLKTRSWEDQDGQKHYVTEVVGDFFQMLGGPRDERRPPSPSSEGNASPPETQSAGEEDDDIPF